MICTGERVLASVVDLSLLYYSGLPVQRPRNAVSLEALLQDYFQHPVRVWQFQG
jgi:predicted component of type VI protein secretion system